jgi:cytochrome c-type biogenesis protein CcmE
MTRKQKRLSLIGAAVAAAAGSAALVFIALGDAVAYFYAPSDVAALAAPPAGLVRLGGLVETGSVRSTDAPPGAAFEIGDGAAKLPVRYQGILPDLFREGQGVVVEGRFGPDGTFDASRVLAKHDETYMPREVADALKKQGRWRGNAPTP